MMMRMPPMMEASDRESPVSSQSTMATKKMVNRAATEDRTGDVRDIRTRKEPEKAETNVSILTDCLGS